MDINFEKIVIKDVDDKDISESFDITQKDGIIYIKNTSDTVMFVKVNSEIVDGIAQREVNKAKGV